MTVVSNHKRPISHFLKCTANGARVEPGKVVKRAWKNFLVPRGPITVGDFDSRSSFVLGIDHRVEKIGDEVGKVVGVVMGEENVRDPMPIHTGFMRFANVRGPKSKSIVWSVRTR